MAKTAGLVIEPSDRVAFVGKTQSGKTHAAGILLSGIRRLVVIDPKGKLSNSARQRADKYSWHLTEWHSREGGTVREAMQRGEAGRLRVPAPLDGNYEPYFRWAYGIENVTVYIDEMYGTVTGTRPGQWLNALYTRGAEMGIGVWACTQRPSNVPAIMFSESEWLFLFRLTKADDRKKMREEIGESAMLQLSPRQFWLNHDTFDAPVYYPYITQKKGR